MAQLASPASLLAVEMEVHPGQPEQPAERRHAADQVDRHGRCPRGGEAEREAEDRAQMVLELARLRPVDRPVTGVVHARRELVGEQPAARPRTTRGPARRRSRARRAAAAASASASACRRARGRRPRDTEDRRRGGRSRRAARTASRRRRSAREISDSSRSNGTSSSASSSGPSGSVDPDDPLALAVVPEPPRLDDRRQPGLGQVPNRGSGSTSRRNNSFSVRRSWPSSSARDGGRPRPRGPRPPARSRTRR